MENKPRNIGSDEYVTQYGSQGNKPTFWDHPRPKDRGALSVTLGRLTPAEIRRLVRLEGAPTREDGARYARAGDLRKRGFSVTHQPSGRNPDHAVIRYPREWDARVAGIFNENFSAPVWHEELEGGTK